MPLPLLIPLAAHALGFVFRKVGVSLIKKVLSTVVKKATTKLFKKGIGKAAKKWIKNKVDFATSPDSAGHTSSHGAGAATEVVRTAINKSTPKKSATVMSSRDTGETKDDKNLRTATALLKLSVDNNVGGNTDDTKRLIKINTKILEVVENIDKGINDAQDTRIKKTSQSQEQENVTYVTNVFNSYGEAQSSEQSPLGALLSGLTILVPLLFNALCDVLPQVFGALWDDVRGFIEESWNAIKENISAYWNEFVDGVKGAWDSVTDFVLSGWASYKNIILKSLGFVREFAENVFPSLVDAWDSFFSTVSDSWDTFFGFVQDAWTGVYNFILPVVDKLKDIISTVTDLIPDIGSALSSFGTQVFSPLEKVSSLLPTPVGAVVSTIGSFFGFTEKEEQEEQKIASAPKDNLGIIKDEKHQSSDLRLSEKPQTPVGLSTVTIDNSVTNNLVSEKMVQNEPTDIRQEQSQVQEPQVQSSDTSRIILSRVTSQVSDNTTNIVTNNTIKQQDIENLSFSKSDEDKVKTLSPQGQTTISRVNMSTKYGHVSYVSVYNGTDERQHDTSQLQMFDDNGKVVYGAGWNSSKYTDTTTAITQYFMDTSSQQDYVIKDNVVYIKDKMITVDPSLTTVPVKYDDVKDAIESLPSESNYVNITKGNTDNSVEVQLVEGNTEKKENKILYSKNITIKNRKLFTFSTPKFSKESSSYTTEYSNVSTRNFVHKDNRASATNLDTVTTSGGTVSENFGAGNVSEHVDLASVEGIHYDNTGPMPLGRLSEKYESNGDAGSVSSGRIRGGQDRGGRSYGLWQLTSQDSPSVRNGGNVMRFLNSPEGSVYRPLFDGLEVNSQDFIKTWKAIAKSDKSGFSKAQYDYIKRTHYDPQMKKIEASGVRISSPVVKDVVWSTAVQHGPNTSIIVDAAAKSGITDDTGTNQENLIKAIYNERGRRFSACSKRYVDEMNNALKSVTQVTTANTQKRVVDTVLDTTSNNVNAQQVVTESSSQPTMQVTNVVATQQEQENTGVDDIDSLLLLQNDFS